MNFHSKLIFCYLGILGVTLASSCTSIKSKVVEGMWRQVDDQTISGQPVIYTVEFFPDGTVSQRKNGECPPEPYSCLEKWRFVSDDQLAITDGKKEMIYKTQIKQNALLLTRTTNSSETVLLLRCYSNDTGVTVACGS